MKTAWSYTAIEPETLTVEQFREELDFAYDRLKKDHPNLNVHIKRRDLDRFYRELGRVTEATVTIREAYLRLSQLFAAVCDSHTALYLPQLVQAAHQNSWLWTGGQLYLRGDELVYRGLPYFKPIVIERIDDTSAETIVRSLRSQIVYDGCVADPDFQLSNNAQESNIALNLAMEGKTGLQIRGWHYEKSEEVPSFEKTLNHDFITKRQESQNSFQRRQDSAKRRAFYQHDFLLQQQDFSVRKAGIAYHFSLSHNAALLTIDGFPTDDATVNGINIAMRRLISDNPDVLFLDLTNNPGGNLNHAQRVAAFLLPRSHRFATHVRMRNTSFKKHSTFRYSDPEYEKFDRSTIRQMRQFKRVGGVRRAQMRKVSFGMPDYKGPIYILVGPNTRSAAMLLAVNLKRLRGATIVGRISSGATWTNCAKALGYYELPHSGIQMYIPNFCFENVENKRFMGALLKPDIAIDHSAARPHELPAKTFQAAIKHYLNSRDTQAKSN